jgi:YbbR domain-containing protein
MSASDVVKDWLRRAFFENAAYKLVALLLSLTLFIVVHGDKDTVISFYLRVGYTEPSDRVMVSKPVDSVRVTVKGPWTRIRRFDERTVEPLHVDLTRLSDGEFVFGDDMIKLPPGLRVVSVNPPSIRLQFEERATKVIAVRPILDGDPAHGYRVDKIEASPAFVMVRGPKGVIDALSEVKTRPIDVSGRKETMEAQATLDAPEQAVEVVDRPVIQVRVAIVEDQSELLAEKVPVTVRWMGPQALPGSALFHVEPESVTVRLRGPRNVLEGITVAELSAYVTLHAEDVSQPGLRPARVIVEGVPKGVALDVDPREVALIPGQRKR